MLRAATPNISSSARNTIVQPVFQDYLSVFYDYGKRNVKKWRVLKIYESEFYYLNILYWMSHALLHFVSKYIDLIILCEFWHQNIIWVPIHHLHVN